MVRCVTQSPLQPPFGVADAKLLISFPPNGKARGGEGGVEGAEGVLCDDLEVGYGNMVERNCINSYAMKSSSLTENSQGGPDELTTKEWNE